MIIETISGKTCGLEIALGKLLEMTAHLILAHLRRDIIVPPQHERFRNIGIEIIKILYAASPEHLGNILGSMRKISVNHGKVQT